MNELLRNLLLYIVFHLQDEEADISSIRLIKLLYLIDIEHIERFGKPLTNIDWIRYKHGPYFNSWPRLLKAVSLDIEPEEFISKAGHKGRTYKTELDQEPELDEIKSYASKVLIDNVLKKWMFEDTEAILEHVYKTEPMHHAEFEEPLDLTYAHDVVAIQQARDTIDDILTIEELLDELGIDDLNKD